jgi:hypothetical protein
MSIPVEGLERSVATPAPLITIEVFESFLQCETKSKLYSQGAAETDFEFKNGYAEHAAEAAEAASAQGNFWVIPFASRSGRVGPPWERRDPAGPVLQLPWCATIFCTRQLRHILYLYCRCRRADRSRFLHETLFRGKKRSRRGRMKGGTYAA